MAWEKRNVCGLELVNVPAALLMLLMLATQGSAFAAPTGDVYEQQQRAKRQEQEQQARINAPFVGSAVEATGKDEVQLPLDLNSFKIDEFVIEDGGQGFQWLKQELVAFRHRHLGNQRLVLLLKRLENKLQHRGYITTRVTVPEQDLHSGKLVIKVIPGYIEAIRFADEHKSGTWRNAFPCGAGDILNTFALDQGLEQMQRVPNQRVKLRLEPGSTPEKTIVLLELERTKAWQAGFSWDDSGLPSTGRHQGSTNLSFLNPTGLNDVLSVSYSHDTAMDSVKGSRNYSFSYSIPYKNYDFYVNKYYSEYDQRIPSAFPYTQKGKTDTWEFGMQRLLYRDRQRKTQLSAKLIHRHKENFLNGEKIDVQELQTSAYQLGLMHRQYIGRAVVDAMVYYQKGIPSFSSMPGIDDHDPDYMTTRYSMWGFNFYYGTPFQLFGNKDVRYSLTARGQFTSDMLYSADLFSIGGRYTVRGFSGENTLSAENGVVARNEFSFPFKKLQLIPYLGVDYGTVWGKSDQYNLGKTLAGAYLGARGKVGALNIDAFVGAPLYKPSGFRAGKTACGFSLYLDI